MTAQPRPEDLARLAALVHAQQANLAAQRARIARLERRRRHRLPRRPAAVALVALLAALLPLALLAAGPFTDLNPGPDHAAANADIQAIADAGITRGCNPPDDTAYCPNDLVTREQMASFLARGLGLGGNPPVANAANAATVGGLAPAGLVRVAARQYETAITLGRTYTEATEVTIIAPGKGFVLVTASANAFTAYTSGCPCNILLELFDATLGAPAAGVPITGTLHNYTPFPPPYSTQEVLPLANTWVIPVGAGRRTFQARLRQEEGTALVSGNARLTALYVPFGYDGGTTLQP